MHGSTRLGGLLCCVMTLAATDGVPAQNPDEVLASCPGGAEWHASEQARHASLKLPDISPRKPELRDELLRMEREDQAVRAALSSAPMPTKDAESRMLSTDAANTARLKEIMREHGGFPAAADVGRDGVAAAWLLVQHADRDPAFQQQILPQLAGLGEADGISREQIALLTDRVFLAQGKPQQYGSQYSGNPGDRLVMRPVEDPARLDERRARMHMMPSATYACALERMGQHPPSKTATP